MQYLLLFEDETLMQTSKELSEEDKENVRDRMLRVFTFRDGKFFEIDPDQGELEVVSYPG